MSKQPVEGSMDCAAEVWEDPVDGPVRCDQFVVPTEENKGLCPVHRMLAVGCAICKAKIWIYRLGRALCKDHALDEPGSEG